MSAVSVLSTAALKFVIYNELHATASVELATPSSTLDQRASAPFVHSFEWSCPVQPN